MNIITRDENLIFSRDGKQKVTRVVSLEPNRVRKIKRVGLKR